ncbi:unnamed protein product [Sphenostylis stenocarpa]|uniref:Uncharacterized protein n=1 Tax=Sphenostylis stenocarpa TaxID=92480 RepID=A0AA86SRQ3_9FABA|nr:unnamed protein product [Sphenostylis stenocarpa]
MQHSSNNSSQRKGKREPRRGSGIPALEMMMREEKRAKKDSEPMDGNQPSSTWQNYLLPPSNSQVLPSLQSSMEDHEGVSNSKFTRGFYRYAKWGTNTVRPHSKFPPFSRPLLPQDTQNNLDSNQPSESSGPRPKPFYNFLKVKESEGVTEDINPGRREAGSDDIDLNLKL